MTEKQFQRQVLQLARFYGWKAYHTFDSRRSCDGFPDLVLAKLGRTPIHAELKTQTGEVSPEQIAWLESLGGYLWRPSQLQVIADLLAD
jgi:hypothetical protein